MLGYFLSWMYQPNDLSMPVSQELRKALPDITTFRKTTIWCNRMIHHVCGISTNGISKKLMPTRKLHNQPCTLLEKLGSSQGQKHIILIPVSYYHKKYNNQIFDDELFDIPSRA